MGAAAMTDEQLIEMAKAHGIDATRLSTVVSFARAVERAAREAVLKEITEAFHASVVAALREGS
jgi:post-segregation antitoxin (ccd killing protein)